VSSYVYCKDNPVIAVDPDGKIVIPVHGTWSDNSTWKQHAALKQFTTKVFGDGRMDYSFNWSGGNYAKMRTAAANALINHIRLLRRELPKGEPITLVGQSHGGNVDIEALNMMVKMPEFDGVKFNLLTINTPVRPDYQLSDAAQKRVNHINVYDSKDPVQVNGGNSIVILPENQSNTFLTGEFGNAGRIFSTAKNIEVDMPQGVMGDYHDSHNRCDTWTYKIKTNCK
jgi:hypothetical protein